MKNIQKDDATLQLLSSLATVFGADGLCVVDDWEADLCAIGIAKPGADRPLLYVSTFQKEQGRYYAEVELPPEPGSELPFAQGPRFEDVSFSDLIALAEKHVGIRRID